MEPPPLTLEILRITPCTLVPGLGPGGSATGLTPSPGGLTPNPPTALPISPLAPVLRTALPVPTLPPALLSTTSNYPGPFGVAAVGETLKLSVNLRNTSGTPVRGAKMMLEIQSPTGRFRLGEAIHGVTQREEGSEPSQAENRTWDDIPALQPEEGMVLDGQHDIAELKDHILICSVAWETPDGRRTFQRFMKFLVNTPIDIKTRVYAPSQPNTVLSPHRGDIYLEVLMQNISPAAMVFERVVLDPVLGLQARGIGKADVAAVGVVVEDSKHDGEETPSLLPGDTIQRLFVVSPTEDAGPTPALDGPQGQLLANLPLSSFPASYATGTVLPLGWLDIAWVAGPYRERGRFQTSTLKRRTTPAPIVNPAPGSRPGTPNRMSLSTATIQPGSARNSLAGPRWEFDLVLDTPRSVPIEEEFEVNFKLSVRSAPVFSEDASPPPPPTLQIGLQMLARPPPPQPMQLPPSLSVRPPSRLGTPSLADRPASPTASLVRSPSTSRPMTPVSQQLRHAAVSNLASPVSTPRSVFTPPPPVPVVAPAAAFPPQPVGSVTVKRGVAAPPQGKVVPLGASLVLPTPLQWTLKRDRTGTTYAAEVPGTTIHRRWEANYEIPIKFLALIGGLAELGGARVLLMDENAIGREWESLGDVWVVDE